MSSLPVLTYPKRRRGSSAFYLKGAGSTNSIGIPFTLTSPTFRTQNIPLPSLTVAQAKAFFFLPNV